MGIFALGIEDPFDVTVQRLHDPDPRHHRGPAAAASIAVCHSGKSDSFFGSFVM
jgi:hypothetical protein